MSKVCGKRVVSLCTLLPMFCLNALVFVTASSAKGRPNPCAGYTSFHDGCK